MEPSNVVLRKFMTSCYAVYAQSYLLNNLIIYFSKIMSTTQFHNSTSSFSDPPLFVVYDRRHRILGNSPSLISICTIFRKIMNLDRNYPSLRMNKINAFVDHDASLDFDFFCMNH